MTPIMELSVNVHHEDGSYWADVPDLPGCFASGDTLDDLLSSLREGIDLYLDDGDRGIPPPPLQIKSAVLSDTVAA